MDAPGPQEPHPLAPSPIAPPPTGRGGKDARFPRLLFLVALLIRLAFVWQIQDLPTQRWLVMDAQRYDELARGIAAGGWMPREVFYQAPLYPYVLGTVYAVTGGGGDLSRLAVRLLQAVLGALTVVLLAALARRLFGREAGWATGALAALYGPAIFYVPLLLKSTLTLLSLTGAVWLLLPGEHGASWKRALGSGLLFGLSALLQENLLLLIPCAALWLLLPWGGGPWRSRMATAGALILGAGLGVAPATLLNVLAGGEMVLTSSQGGMNFYIGNSRGASGTYGGLSKGSQNPDSQREDARRMAAGFATREQGRPVAPGELAPGEVSALFWRESFRQIRADPAAWGRLLLRKLRLFWNVQEIPDAEGYDVYRREGGWPARLWLGFGIVAPLGLAGLCLSWFRAGSRREARLLALLAAGLCASVVLFFVFGRYRLPVVVLLLPPAGYAVAALVDAVRHRAARQLALAAVLVVLAATAVNLPAWPAAERERLDTAIWFNLSSAALRGAEAAYGEHRLEEAITLTARAADDLARVLALDPGFYVARLQRAVALHRQGTYLSRAGVLDAALRSAEEARRELDLAQASGGGHALPEAELQARQLAAALDAGTAQILVNLGGRKIEAGDLAGAEAALRRAVRLSPRSAPTYGNLGLCLLHRSQQAGEDAAGSLRAASRAAFARALELAGPGARPEVVAFYRRGLERAGG